MKEYKVQDAEYQMVIVAMNEEQALEAFVMYTQGAVMEYKRDYTVELIKDLTGTYKCVLCDESVLITQYGICEECVNAEQDYNEQDLPF